MPTGLIHGLGLGFEIGGGFQHQRGELAVDSLLRRRLPQRRRPRTQFALHGSILG